MVTMYYYFITIMYLSDAKTKGILLDGNLGSCAVCEHHVERRWRDFTTGCVCYDPKNSVCCSHPIASQFL